MAEQEERAEGASFSYEERNEERWTVDGAFTYRPCFPFLYKTERTRFNGSWVGRLVITPVFVVLGPLVAAFRLLAFVLLQSLVTLCSYVITWGYPEDEPLRGWRILVAKIVSYPLYFLMLTAWGVILVPDLRRRAKRPRICVSNHVSILDIFLMILCEGPAFVSKRGVSRVPLMGKAMEILRVMYVREGEKGEKESGGGGATALFERRLAAMRRDPGWRPIHIFPEGTTTTEQAVLRFHTSVFRLGEEVQPICIRYVSYNPVAYVGQDLRTVVYRYLTNPFVLAFVTYLDPVSPFDAENGGALKEPRAFADEVGQAIARELGATYLPYSNEDAFFFRGLKTDANRCTPEFQRDYGWLGTLQTTFEERRRAEEAEKSKKD
ncbi:Lyso-PAF acetyltransferase/Lysophosphatidylcholine acyltransferase [Giardia muris]|uniref:Lyso-PAF acetyltransferase/Lysophosphatidylcholine acyltransferase n=1 Tax=Giardia muris TaxID=5742 RepID=A0A4Z1STQ2_GIAMU|nr:Lyso-PAF acetyltransferase/Lysophosphatidylcholine acyltransferase [Giardia muris]|eukprot:TNJ29296.1 Lyso-PAF acetyltransferase/Lysophosphatidylcholine acyltransferase [Giardia muris]